MSHQSYENYDTTPLSIKNDPGYCDGDCSPYEGANAGRDQDQSRVDERIPASCNYGGKLITTMSFGSPDGSSQSDTGGAESDAQGF